MMPIGCKDVVSKEKEMFITLQFSFQRKHYFIEDYLRFMKHYNDIVLRKTIYYNIFS